MIRVRPFFVLHNCKVLFTSERVRILLSVTENPQSFKGIHIGKYSEIRLRQ